MNGEGTRRVVPCPSSTLGWVSLETDTFSTWDCHFSRTPGKNDFRFGLPKRIGALKRRHLHVNVQECSRKLIPSCQISIFQGLIPFPFFSTIVLFNNQPLFSRKKDAWKEWTWKVYTPKIAISQLCMCQTWLRILSRTEKEMEG